MNKAPWSDFNGKDICEGAVLEHPSGECGIVVFMPDENDPCDQWRVDYGGGVLSRLCLQVGDRGMATLQPKANTEGMPLGTYGGDEYGD